MDRRDGAPTLERGIYHYVVAARGAYDNARPGEDELQLLVDPVEGFQIGSISFNNIDGRRGGGRCRGEGGDLGPQVLAAVMAELLGGAISGPAVGALHSGGHGRGGARGDGGGDGKRPRGGGAR